ncbi:hypothetical protein O9993_15195 [Vibrio lentus]|nr:hypothetical protein [Vibrio lentus]
MRTRRVLPGSGSETFTLTQSLAELDADATSVAPEEADVGGVVTVTAVFTKAVSKLTTATLGSNTAVWIHGRSTSDGL